jgi:hypothetical protein
MMTQSTVERDEHLREKWIKEFADHALATLVDNAMADCPLTDRSIGGTEFNLRVALGACFETVPVDVRIEWAHRLDSECLDFESYVEQQTGEDEGE